MTKKQLEERCSVLEEAFCRMTELVGEAHLGRDAEYLARAIKAIAKSIGEEV